MYTFIAEEQADPDSPWSTAEMCRVLQVSRSGFYDWLCRPPSDRQVSDALLAAEIEAIWDCSARTYGAPRVHAWLRRRGYRVARKRVARIMREHGRTGVMGRIRVRTTRRDKTAAPAPDLVARAFNPDAPDRIWAGDVTYLRTGQGWLYLATVIDLYSRRVIGWALADHLRADLVCDALTMAVATRGGSVDGVVFHSDRGCQGGFKWSSQHPEVRGCAGSSTAAAGRSWRACANALTGARPGGAASAPAAVLVGDRAGVLQRGCGCGGRGVPGGWDPLVP